MSEIPKGPIEVFISHKWDAEENRLAQQLYQKITAKGFHTFLDVEKITLGERWVETLDRSLKECKIFIVLLSPASVRSEMVIEEVRTIKKRWETATNNPEKGPVPFILPIRYHNPALPLDLRSYLNRFQHAELQPGTDPGSLWQEIAVLVSTLLSTRSTVIQPVLPLDSEGEESVPTSGHAQNGPEKTVRGLIALKNAFDGLVHFRFRGQEQLKPKQANPDMAYRSIGERANSGDVLEIQGGHNVTIQGANNTNITINISGEEDQVSKPATEEDAQKLKGFIPAPNPIAPARMPTGAMEELYDQFYVGRPGEQQVFQALDTPRAVIRIKGPRQYGKSSLLARLIRKAEKKGFKIINISIQRIQQSLPDLDAFLKQVCREMGRLAGMERKSLRSALEEYWDDPAVSTMKCQYFFEDHILTNSQRPLLIALDEVDLISDHDPVAKVFFPMLRAWVDSTKNDPIWDNFNLVLTYATDLNNVYREMSGSPFNIGVVAPTYEPFGRDELEKLAAAYNFTPYSQLTSDIQFELGGHPFLSQLAFFQVASGRYKWDQLLKGEGKFKGHFRDHLDGLFLRIQNSDLLEALGNVMRYRDTEFLPKLQLEAAGIIREKEGEWAVSCNLYQQFIGKQR